MNEKKSVFTISIYTFIQFVILLITVIIVLVTKENQTYSISEELYLKIIGWISNIIFVWDVFIMYRIKHNVLDFSVVFFVFFFLFCNGQIMLYTLGVDANKMLLFRTSTMQEILDGAIYFLFSMILFCMGAISPLIQKREMNVVISIDDLAMRAAIRDTGLILLMLSIIPYFYLFFSKTFTSLVYGYSALYRNNTQIPGLIGYIAKLFIPALFLLLYVNYYNQFIKGFIQIVLLGIAILGLLSGNRGDGLSIIIVLLIFMQLYGNKFNGGNIIKLIIIAVVIIIVIPVLASFRGMANRNLTVFSNILINSLTNSDKNLIISSITELGATGYAYILTRRAIPAIEGFHYGLSYIASIGMIFPRQLMGGFSFAKYAALDIWLQNIHNLGYGPGFSITAETYYNFGWIGGVIFSFCVGYFFAKMFNLRSNDKNKNEVLRLLSLIFLYNSVIVARFPFHNTVRNIVYIYIVPYFLIMSLYKRKRQSFYKTKEI